MGLPLFLHTEKEPTFSQDGNVSHNLLRAALLFDGGNSIKDTKNAAPREGRRFGLLAATFHSVLNHPSRRSALPCGVIPGPDKVP